MNDENELESETEFEIKMARLPYGWKPEKIFNSVGEYVDMLYPFILKINGNPVKVDSYQHHHLIINHLFMQPLLNK